MFLSNARIAPKTVAPIATRAPRTLRRPQRVFGTGYGNSSGYAADRRYTRDWGNAHFRFA